MYGVNRDLVLSRAEQNEDSRKEALDREKGLRAELIKTVTESTIARAEEQIVWLERAEKATHDFEFLSAVATGFTTGVADIKPPPVYIGSSALPGAQLSYLIVQSADQDRAKKINDALKEGLDGLVEGGKRVKGGGAKGRFMSKVEGKWGKKEIEKMKEIIAGLNEGTSDRA